MNDIYFLIGIFFLFIAVLFALLAVLYAQHSLKKDSSIKSSCSKSTTLSVADIDLITTVINEYMQKLDRENGTGFSLGSAYWPIMLKLKQIKFSLDGDSDG